MKRTARLIVLAAVFGLAAIACGCALAQPALSASKYPKATATAYTKSCIAVAKTAAAGRVGTAAIASYCGCSISYLQARLSYSQFLAQSQAELTLSAGSAKAKAVFNGALTACEPRLGLTN
jgi:hypothetical protein